MTRLQKRARAEVDLPEMIVRKSIPDHEFLLELSEFLAHMQPLPNPSELLFTPDDVEWLHTCGISIVPCVGR